MLRSEYIGSYDFDDGSEIILWEGSRYYTAIVVTPRSRRRRIVRDTDKQSVLLRAIAIIKKGSKSMPLLVDFEGEPLPFKVRTEDEELRDFAKGFLKEHPEILFNIRYGPEYQLKGGISDSN